jgi:hypothetical protein
MQKTQSTNLRRVAATKRETRDRAKDEQRTKVNVGDVLRHVADERAGNRMGSEGCEERYGH